MSLNFICKSISGLEMLFEGGDPFGLTEIFFLKGVLMCVK